MKRWIMLMVTLSLIVGCSTKVTRLEPDQAMDLSGSWNDTDSRLVAQEMIQDALSHPWISQFESSQGQSPTVIVGTVQNVSHEHINVNTFVSDMERALINSGRVIFVASSQERSEIRKERVDQDLNATDKSRSAAGNEIGADYMLKGQINTLIDVASKDQVRYYQVDLTLISMKDNRKVWLGQKKIKKLVERSKLRY